MAGYIQVPADGVGKKVDTVTLSDAGSEVHRQKMVVTGGSGTAEVVVVTNANPAVGDMGLVVRQAGTASVALVAGAANIGDINSISRTIQAAIATPFTLNNISATVVVAGVVSLNAGGAIIGDVNAISRTVQVAIATPFTINNISATVGVQGTLNVAGQVSVSGAINLYTSGSIPSASRGPRCSLVSTSANATLVAAPGVGMTIFVTQVAVSNASGSNTRARIGTSASIGQVTMMLAASGGGFVMQFNPAWKLSTNEALLGSIKPNASEGIFNVMFYVASADAI